MASTKLTMIIEMADKMSSKLEKLKGKWDKTIDRMKDKYQGFLDKLPGGMGKVVDKLKMPLTTMAAGLAVAIGGMMVKATTMANDWHTQMAEINVTAELSKDKLQGLSDKLLEIGTRNAVPLEQIPKAFSRIISAGLDVNQSMEALEPTLRAAKAGFTDIETVAGAGVAVMMSSGKDINRVYDVLFETVKEGNAEFKDIARYLPRVIPLARSIGYELESTAGAYASLTTKLSVEQSSTALEGIMRTLSNADVAMGKIDAKTGKYVSGFRAVGINIFDSAGKIRPLIDIVKDLNKQMDSLTNAQKVEKLSKLGFDQSTALGFGTLMQDVQGLEKATTATYGAQNSLNKAYMDSLTPMEQWQVIQNNIKGAMIKLGEKILPMVTWALEKLSPVFQWVFENIDALVVVLGSVATAFGVLTIAVWANNIALYANPVGLVVAAIVVLIGIITAAIIKFDEWGAMVLALMGPFGRVIVAIKLLYDHWESIKKAFQTDGIVGALKRIGQVLLDAFLKPLQQGLEMLSDLPGVGNIAGNWAGKIEKLRGDMKLIQEKTDKKDEGKKGSVVDNIKNLYSDIFRTTGGNFNGTNGTEDGKKSKGKLLRDIDKISGDAKQIRNITINFDSVHKGDNVVSPSGKGMSMQEFEQFYNDMMMRVIRNAETI
ncbi:MAG: phage tail tape measure protein [Bergeyella cardium]|nr:MAG TPA: minor tail protein [Caudoviricetes sp.]